MEWPLRTPPSDDVLPWPRLFGVGLVAAGVGHLVAPRLLLRVAATGYDRILDVSFTPRSDAARRVRLVGIGMIAAGLHLLYHGGIVPKSDGRDS